MKVSIITVAYNSERTIRDAIESVLRQDYAGIEYLIVDGASTDDTVAVAEEYGDRIARLVSEPDDGIYDAMNKGIRIATGDVVGFLNSDDFYPCADSVSRIVEALTRTGADSCYGDLCYVSRDDPERVVRYWKSSPFAPGLFHRGWNPPHPTFFVRRHLYEQHGGFDLSYRLGADVEIMMRLLEVHRVSWTYLPERLVHMRLGGATNASVKNILHQNREVWHALRQYGLARSLPAYVAGKLVLRAKQLVGRPG